MCHIPKITYENDQTCSLSNINESFSLRNSINHYRKLKFPRVIKTETESEEEHSYSQISETSDSEDYNDLTTQNFDSSELESSAESIECSDQDSNSQTLELPDQALHEEISSCKHQFEKKFHSTSLLEQILDSDVLQKTDGASELITKLSDFAKNADLNIEVIMHEQMNDPVVSIEESLPR